MEKIITLFERNSEGAIVDQKVKGIDINKLLPTEKLDGTNVRLTVRKHTLVRVEKRRNPTKPQKKQGIVTPWYVDATKDPNDKYILEAANSTYLEHIPDGEWSGEAVGEKIQGNPLNLKGHKVFLFSHYDTLLGLALHDAPNTYYELKDWLPKQKSKLGNDCPIEGVVWWDVYNMKPIAKIKTKDYK